MRIYRIVRRIVRQYGIPISGVAAVCLVLGGYLWVGHQQQTPLPEGGIAQSTQTPGQTVRLSPVVPEPTSVAQTIATSQCAENTKGKMILVSINQQHMWACDGQNLAKDSVVTTGASGLTNVDDGTPTGTWHIYAKYVNTVLRGCDVNGCWYDPVAYWMPFDGEIGFHDASWQTFPFGDGKYVTQGSHGCVHLPTDIAGWVYSWAAVGTIVTVIS